MRRAEYESVTALDVDAVPALDAAHPEAWLALDAASDVFGASNVGKPVLVNGGVLVLRNTAWARELVRAWWRNRCGPADQYALWKSLAELWRRDHPKFRLADGVFANYASARERFLPEVARRIADGALPARGCAADATCAALRGNQPVRRVHRQFFTKPFLGNDAADLARSSGEEPASPRRRAGVASMAWRTNAP